MKKLTTILLALIVVLFTQCKKDNIDNTDTNTDTDVRKVKVRCEIPLGNGTRSDFTNLMTDGSIKWSTGTERIYLAVHHETNAQIVELTAETTQTATVLAFEGEVDETILTDGETYNVWYLGNSQNLGENSYVTKTETSGVITSVNGSISNQSGSLEDLGHHHIAKAEVTATLEADGSYTLPLHGTLQNQIAIAYMDLTDVTKLLGDAIVGTDYSLEYSNGEYNFVINNENNEISINPKSLSMSESFVVLLPNANTNVDITNGNYHKYTFKDGIAASSLYYRYISDVEIGTLKWELMEGYGENNGHTYVDLGLPSGLKWATCNVGADNYWEYGNYYAWGETSPKDNYTWETYKYCNEASYQMMTKYCSDASYGYNGFTDNLTELVSEDDAATQNMGVDWRTPTCYEWKELMEHCNWTWTTVNGVNGHVVQSKTNQNSIFLPAAGRSDGLQGSYGFYLSKNLALAAPNCAHYFGVSSTQFIFVEGSYYDFVHRFLGMQVRGVKKQ